MQDFQEDIKTRITFHELDNDGTQIECNVHSKKSQLFYNTNGELFENEILPAIYLVDNRTNCHDLVADGGNITVKYIGAIRGPGVVLADMSEVVKYSQLQGRCLAILRLRGTRVDELLATSTSSTTSTTTPVPPFTLPGKLNIKCKSCFGSSKLDTYFLYITYSYTCSVEIISTVLCSK